MDVTSIARHFSFSGKWQSGKPFGSGHINDTFLLTYEQEWGEINRYILRRINQSVFRQPRPLIENTGKVCRHIEQKLTAEVLPDASRRVLKLILANGAPWFRDETGEYWCAYRFVEDTVAIDTVESLAQAYEAARAFGRFQRQLADLDPAEIVETIPWFHHLARRYDTFEQAIADDSFGRLKEVGPEVEFILSRKSLASPVLQALEAGSLPLRVIHNDTKVNNVLLDEITGEGLCVIDLDTVMPGTVIYDFGDMVRTFTSPAAEDEQDLTQVSMRMDIFEALTRGYLSEAHEFLTTTERSMLVYGAKLLTMLMGIRFLTDYLMGDVYYKIHRPTHNLDRSRTQLELLRHIEHAAEEMEQIVRKYEPEA
jgi:aminoglycoside phosphotransferase (APT) family kinase protein